MTLPCVVLYCCKSVRSQWGILGRNISQQRIQSTWVWLCIMPWPSFRAVSGKQLSDFLFSLGENQNTSGLYDKAELQNKALSVKKLYPQPELLLLNKKACRGFWETLLLELFAIKSRSQTRTLPTHFSVASTQHDNSKKQPITILHLVTTCLNL